MTNTYNTLNPLGSTSAKDLFDNASNFDEAMNSSSPSFYDRFLKRRETWAGMEKMVSDFLEAMGFEATHLVYVDGTPLTVLRPTQLVDRAGSVYKVKQPASFPVNLTGTWATDQLLLVDVGDASLRMALASSTGATMVGYGSSTVAKTLDTIRRVTIDQFAVVGQTNWDDAMAAARAYMDSSPTPTRLVFPAGIYEYTVSPNWAKQDCDVVGEGEVRFRYSGTGNAFILDAGPLPADLVYNMDVGPFIIEAPASALDGVFIRSIHHSDLDFTVRGAGVSSAGTRINFAVCNTLKLTCSVNQEGWYLGAQPQYGIVMDIRGAAEQTAYNTFLNPIIEGVTDGIRMPGALGNSIFGGTSEACTNGVIIGPLSYANKFYGIDLEANLTVDVLCQGYENEFHSVDSDKYCLFDTGSRNNVVFGGNFAELDMPAGGTGNIAIGSKVNRSNNGTTLSIAGSNRRLNCYDVGANKWLTDINGPRVDVAFAPPTLVNGDRTQATLTVTGATLGMFVQAAFSQNLAGIELSACVSTTDTIIATFINRTGGTISLASGILSVKAEI